MAMAHWSALSAFLKLALWASENFREKWGALFWAHDLALCVSECEPQAGAGQAGSVDTTFV